MDADLHRGTGRTSAQLSGAAHLARVGKSVVYIAPNWDYAERLLRRLVPDAAEYNAREFKIGDGYLRFASSQHDLAGTLNRLRGSKAVVIYDHAVCPNLHCHDAQVSSP